MIQNSSKLEWTLFLEPSVAFRLTCFIYTETAKLFPEIKIPGPLLATRTTFGKQNWNNFGREKWSARTICA